MFLLIVIVSIFLLLLVNQYSKRKSLPPGPTPLPLIGNIHQIVYYAWKTKSVVSVLDIFRKKYGNAFTVWLGPFPSVSIADFETAHEVFIKNRTKTEDRQLAPIFEHITGGLGLLTANGENWAEMRRFTFSAFRSLGVGSNVLERRIMEELNGRCSELNSEIAQNGRAIVPCAFFDLTVGSVINSILVGKRFGEDNKDEFLFIKKLFDDSTETFSLFDTIMPLWILKTFFPWRFQLTWDARSNIVNYVSREVVQRYEDFNSGNYKIDPEDPSDFMDGFLLKVQQEQEKADGGHPAYTMESLKMVLMDLWLAGQGTTATTLYVGFTKLVKHPKIFEKLREELLLITDNGKRDLELQDRPKTPYLNATIAEIQRHASILNVNFWRINNETIHFQGYRVDPGTMISAQLSIIHQNENMFESPTLFSPERFLKNEKLLQQVIPFGIGKRSCVGENIARAELYLVFGNLLLRYDVREHGTLPYNEDVFPMSSAKLPDTSGQFEFVRLQDF